MARLRRGAALFFLVPLLAQLGPNVAAARVVVSFMGTDCPEAGDPPPISIHTTVQAGINAALAAGDPQLEICPGNYAEEVVVNDGGAGRTLEIRGKTGVQSDVFVTSVSGDGPIIDVVAATRVEIADLTIDGFAFMTPAVPNGPVYGVRYALVDGAIENVSIQNIRNADGSAFGIGITFIGSGSGPEEVEIQGANTLELTDTAVRNATGFGIQAEGNGVVLEITSAQVDDPFMPLQFEPNLFAVFGNAEVAIEEATFGN